MSSSRWNIGLIAVVVSYAVAVCFLVDARQTLADAVFSWALLAGLVLYVASHLFRSARLWVVLSLHQFPFLEANALHLSSSTMGNVSNVALGELFKIILFSLSFGKELPRIIMSIIYIRMMDLAFILVIMLYLINSNVAIDNRFFFLAYVLLVFSFGFLFFLPVLCEAIGRYFLKYKHQPYSVHVLRSLNSIKETHLKMKGHKSENYFLIFTMTTIIWTLEFMAIYLMAGETGNADLWNSMTATITNIARHIQFSSVESDVAIRHSYRLGYLVIFGLSLISLFIARLPWRKP